MCTGRSAELGLAHLGQGVFPPPGLSSCSRLAQACSNDNDRIRAEAKAWSWHGVTSVMLYWPKRVSSRPGTTVREAGFLGHGT